MPELTLRLNGDPRTTLQLRNGDASIGSGADNTLVLNGDDILPRHALVSVGTDGAMLRPASGQAQVQINQRPVQALAFLRDGDQVELGGHLLHVSVSESQQGPVDDGGDRATQVRRVPPKFLLRGIGGTEAGRLIPVYGRLLIGRSQECDLVLSGDEVAPQHVLLKALSDGLFLRDQGSGNGCLVNGKRVRDGELRPGDRLEIGQTVLLVQSIDANAAGNGRDQTAPRSGGRGNRLALVLAVVLIVAAIAAALLLR